MKPGRWQEIERLFHAALEQRREDRAAFISAACTGDEELRRQVESLLACASRVESFIETPALELVADILAEEQTHRVGQSIGHYRIISLLGAGGMGEVYLAQDRKLGRRTALKFLPHYFTNDQERLRRFKQEARTASALNHPNILTIYEIGEAEGSHFIASEFVDGVTLREHMAGEPLELDEALQISMQIASALMAAHAKGVVHRDIKPENVMVLRENYSLHGDKPIKVLDFGIAKLTEPLILGTQAPTRPLVITHQSQVLGTASYMSPEQARGETIDGRTDTWSLGVVLYEMITGKIPFGGEKPQDLMASILKDEPAPLPSKIPQSLSWVVKKALCKERADRYQTAGEMLSDLRDIQVSDAGRERSVLREPGGEKIGSTEEGATTRSTSSAEYLLEEIKRLKPGAVIGLAVAALLFSGIAFAVYKFVISKSPAPAVPFQNMKITRLTSTGKIGSATISPDGRYVVHTVNDGGKESLRLRQVATNRDTEIVPPAAVGYFGLTFSPDGNTIYYALSELDSAVFGTLYQVSVLGGDSRRLLTNIHSPIGLSPDGRQLAFVRRKISDGLSSLLVANTDGSGERTLATRNSPYFFDYDGPAWSPDGKLIACGVGSDVGTTSHSVVTVPAEGGQERPITSHKWFGFVGRLAWLKNGSGLIVAAYGDSASDAQIWYVSYPGGEVRRITNDLSEYETNTLDLTADSGTLVAVQDNLTSRIWVAAPDKGANGARKITDGKFDGIYNGLAWMPDGKIVYVTREGGNQDIWVMNQDGTEKKQLTADPHRERFPTVTPDGRYIVFASDRSGVEQLWRMDTDGTNQKQLTADDAFNTVASSSPDGQWLFFVSHRDGKQLLWKVSIEGGEAVRLTDKTSTRPLISPDGRLFSCGYYDEEVRPNRWRVAIIPSEGGQPIKILDHVPQGAVWVGHWWTPDGRRLVYVDTQDGVSNVWSRPIENGPPKQVTDFTSDQIFAFALSGDGKQLVLARGSRTSDVVLISDSR